jgi:hypothetical protein
LQTVSSFHNFFNSTCWYYLVLGHALKLNSNNILTALVMSSILTWPHLCTVALETLRIILCSDLLNSLFVQLMHTNYSKLWIIKIFIIITVAPTCFGLHQPSSGSHNPCLAKITLLVQVYMSLQTFSVLRPHMWP